MTPLTYSQAQALAGLMREHDSQDAIVLEVGGRTIAVTLFDETNMVQGTGSISRDGHIREHGQSAA